MSSIFCVHFLLADDELHTIYDFMRSINKIQGGAYLINAPHFRAMFASFLHKYGYAHIRVILMGLGERLKELRGEQSVAEFCRQFGIHRNTLPRYESGERTPDADFIAALCKHYGVNPSWLLLGEGLMRKEAVAPGQQTECTDPRCVGALHTHGHIMAKVPQFDAEVLAHIFKELHDYKAANPDILSEKQALDIISLASVFLQPENKVEAELICSIVKKWLDTGKK